MNIAHSAHMTVWLRGHGRRMEAQHLLEKGRAIRSRLSCLFDIMINENGVTAARPSQGHGFVVSKLVILISIEPPRHSRWSSENFWTSEVIWGLDIYDSGHHTKTLCPLLSR